MKADDAVNLLMRAVVALERIAEQLDKWSYRDLTANGDCMGERLDVRVGGFVETSNDQ